MQDKTEQIISDSRQVSLEKGKGGFINLRVRNRTAEACISLYGGQILSYMPIEEDELLFLSEKAWFKTGKSIKGGIPICWPWFGKDPSGNDRPFHGFARNRLWKLEHITETELSTKITLQLEKTDEDDALWQQEYRLQMTYEIGHELCVSLTTFNDSESTMEITQALHTYFSVSDIGDVKVSGFDGCNYLDKAKSNTGKEQKQQQGDIVFTGEVDRIYKNNGDEFQIEDAQRKILIATTGSQTSIVWNPGKELSVASADLADDAYRKFVCVETANADTDVINIKPKENYTITASYRIERLQS